MAVVILLQDVVAEMDVPHEQLRAYLNRTTGELISLTLDDLLAAEEDMPLDHALEWQRPAIEKAHEVLCSGDFLALPDRHEIHEYSIMERFSLDVANPVWSEQLLSAIDGRGAFRYFRDTIRRLGIEDHWRRYRARALEDIAIAWLDSHQIAYRKTRSGE